MKKLKIKQISSYFDDIYVEGIVDGHCEYFIVRNNDKSAVFDKNNKQVTNWYDDIIVDGLFTGDSNYFMVYNNNKFAIFNDNFKQISDWYDDINVDGLLYNDSEYFIAKNNNLSTFKIIFYTHALSNMAIYILHSIFFKHL